LLSKPSKFWLITPSPPSNSGHPSHFLVFSPKE
jgi:hypothetical protein